jgi:hypothetical protein
MSESEYSKKFFSPPKTFEYKDLNPEALEIIMKKVRDIDAPGQAFTFYVPIHSLDDGENFFDTVQDTGEETLVGILQNGILGHDKSVEINPTVGPATGGVGNWKKDSKVTTWKEQMQARKSNIQVHFNITGRVQLSNPSINNGNFSKREVARTTLWSSRRFGFLYAINALNEINFRSDKLKATQFRENDTGVDTPWGQDRKKMKVNDEFGFVLKNRVAPRWLRGIVMNFWRPRYSKAMLDDLLIKKIIKHKEDYNQEPSAFDISKMKSEITDSILKNEEKEWSDLTLPFENKYFPRQMQIQETDSDAQDEQVLFVAETMMKALPNKIELWLPIYDLNGNLRWPKKIKYEEIKKL